MKYTCPECKATGDVPDNSMVAPTTRIICQNCGAKLTIEQATGRVQVPTHKRPASAARDASGRKPKYDMSPVLTSRPMEKGRKDYVAFGVFAAVICALIVIGVYLPRSLKTDIFNQPMKMITELADDVVEYGKSVWGQIQKERRPKNKQARQAQKHLRKGYDDYKENRLKEALAKLSMAIESDPQNFEAYFWRARAYIRMGQFDSAIKDLNRVVEINPAYGPAYDNLGWLFMRRNKFDESLTHLNKSIDLKPENGWAHYMRGRVYFNKGDLQKAFENANNACQLGNKDGCRDAKRYQSELPQNK
ncbi:MAG: tetratricopeptide repeat protein [Desulfobacterales bacterium]|jgi:tetratricopeptide (TPR) repeat protein/DNA-directed RNA polymerase subunit RPC12/RpoP